MRPELVDRVHRRLLDEPGRSLDAGTFVSRLPRRLERELRRAA